MDNIVEKAKKGNQKAFMLLINSMKTQMYRTAILQLRNEQDALDAIQESMINAFTNIKNLKQNSFFKTWIIRILLNQCHDMQKYKYKVIPMEKEYFDVSGSYEEQGYEDLKLTGLLDGLGDIYKEVADLRYNHDLKLDEIAKILNIPVGTVKSRLNMVHKILRKDLRGREEIL